MIPLTLAEIARAVGGTAHGPVQAMGGPGLTVTGPVVIDSREVTAGTLFAAIAGARSDGHDFAPAAYSAGAVAVLGSRPVDGPCVVADDVVTALTKLAGLVRDRLSPVVIGLTGSVGKTTTKDLLAQILEREAPTVATSRSFNNEIGLPLTILRADRQTRYLVLEMGAAKPRDITHLVRVGRPQIGMVLNVGPAHVLTMGGIDGVAKTKAEMVRDLPTAAEGGFALLNADDERVAAMARQTQATVTFYGTGQGAAVRTALVNQSSSLAGELADGLRHRAERLDDAAERTVRRWLRRPLALVPSGSSSQAARQPSDRNGKQGRNPWPDRFRSSAFWRLRSACCGSVRAPARFAGLHRAS